MWDVDGGAACRCVHLTPHLPPPPHSPHTNSLYHSSLAALCIRRTAAALARAALSGGGAQEGALIPERVLFLQHRRGRDHAPCRCEGRCTGTQNLVEGARFLIAASACVRRRRS